MTQTPEQIAAGPHNKREARRWVRAHWADMVRNSDMGAVADLDNEHLEEVWDDECRKIADRLSPSQAQENTNAD
ncbi:MAG: hypothetical protein ACT6Q7_03020 [Blastomonas fulva]|uniref:hypothetical protein n=1 Tax=Blastomonas fulva TaxID=1550728 RepID=UPI0040349089